ncbi:MAG: branched-chain amino acid aminotransferase [Clostridia bacterium]|nr:branched-chain amino acid aminotransferase [Clostridia bacterium]NCC76586.1 branched-chain amino acid aminotransferase [Clostridia bacterium]
MTRQDLDWENIGFAYHKTNFRYVANFKHGIWEDGGLTSDETVVLNESAGVLQYCQSVFEGLKAYRTRDGKIVTFRPDLNAERMETSAIGLEMPPFPRNRFLEAIDQVVKANSDWVPPFGSGATLYIRPYLFATSPVMGIKPAETYQFRVICTPVGPYFKGGARPLTLCVSDYDRAAPHGTGHLKAGLNYAMSLHAYVSAHAAGYDENLFLDPATRTYVEETGGANFLFVTKEQEIVTPQSGSILPSITRRSMLHVAEHILGLKVSERPVKLTELEDFAECGLCGTAAVISPVGRIVDHGREIRFPSGMERMGLVTQKLYDLLTGMQLGLVESPAGWIRQIC